MSVLLAYDVSLSYAKSKSYEWDVESIPLAISKELRITRTLPNFYEILRGEVKPYFDFDRSYESDDLYNINCEADSGKVSYAIITSLIKFYGIKRTDIDLFQSHGYNMKNNKWKMSFHAIVNSGIHYESGKKLSIDSLKISELVKLFDVVEGLDMSIYKETGRSQYFRLPYNTKKGDIRGLEWVDPSTEIKKAWKDVDSGMFPKWLISFIQVNSQQVNPQAIEPVSKLAPDIETKEPELEPAVEPAVEPEPATTHTNKQYNKEDIQQLIKCLRYNVQEWDWTMWRNIVWSLKSVSIAFNIDLRAEAHIISECNKKYSKYNTDKVYDGGNDSYKIGSLIHWCKQANPEQFKIWLSCDKFLFYCDHQELIKEVRRLSSVVGWIDNCITLIGNGGKMFAMTKNMKIHEKTKETSVYFKTVKYLDLTGSLDVEMRVHNSKFKPDEPEDKKKNNKYMSDCFGILSLSSFLRMRRKKGKIAFYNTVEFSPYLFDPPKLFSSFNLFNEFALIKYKQSNVEYTKNDFDFTKTFTYSHIRDQLCNGDEAVFDFHMKSTAYMFQNPKLMTDVLTVFISAQGLGKDLYATFLALCIGSDYCLNFSDVNAFFSSFNADQANKIFIVINELSDRGAQHKNHGQFKAKITEKTKRIEPKGMDAFSVDNCAHYMAFSNFENCMLIENTDRRMFMIRCSDKLANNHAHFNQLVAEMNDRNIQKLAFDYWTKMDLSEFNPRDVPMTALKAEQAIQNLPNSLAWILDEMSEDKPFEHEVDEDSKCYTFQIKTWFNRYVSWCDDTRSKATTRKAWKTHLAKIGLNYKNHRGTDGQSKCYRFSRDELKAMFATHLKSPLFDFE